MKPNIIFYFSDQQRSDTVNEQLTPNLMKLAKDGVQFSNSFTLSACLRPCGSLPANAMLST